MDKGKRSGYGRVVLIYYELCNDIWGGNPATDKIPGGLGTSALAGVGECDDGQVLSLASSSTIEADNSSTGGSQASLEEEGEGEKAHPGGGGDIFHFLCQQ